MTRFDDDGNQWIDANDEVFSSLSVWVQGDVRTLEEINLAGQDTAQALSPEQALEGAGGRNGGSGESGRLLDARMEAVRDALAKLNEIREKQKAFIEETKELGKSKSPLDEYMSVIDRLRLELLNSQDEKRQVASRYLEFAKG